MKSLEVVDSETIRKVKKKKSQWKAQLRSTKKKKTLNYLVT